MEMYARGLSLRDIEAAFTRSQRALARSAASRVPQRLLDRYQKVANRDLSEPRIAYPSRRRKRSHADSCQPRPARHSG
jgi:hypothetical protein